LAACLEKGRLSPGKRLAERSSREQDIGLVVWRALNHVAATLKGLRQVRRYLFKDRLPANGQEGNVKRLQPWVYRLKPHAVKESGKHAAY